MIKIIKTCQNPECRDAILDYKSAKKEYCNESCRNRAGYLRRGEENKEFMTFDKGIKKNYSVLKLFRDSNNLVVGLTMLERFGFKPKYLAKEFSVKLGENFQMIFQIKDIGFYFESQKNRVIILKKTN